MSGEIKISQLTTQTPNKSDFIPAVNNYPTTVKVTAESLQAVIYDGWQRPENTPLYVSANQFRVSGDYTLYYPIGSKIRLVQSGTTKYFYIANSYYSTPYTYITVFGGSAYSLASDAIASLRISHALEVNDFPAGLSFTPTWSATGGTPTIGNGSISGYLSVIGKRANVVYRLFIGSTTSLGTTTAWTFSLPIAVAATPTMNYLGNVYARDVSANQNYMYTTILTQSATSFINLISSTAASSTVQLAYNVPFSWGANDILSCQIEYPI